jgi:hypothetical protein
MNMLKPLRLKYEPVVDNHREGKNDEEQLEDYSVYICIIVNCFLMKSWNDQRFIILFIKKQTP